MRNQHIKFLGGILASVMIPLAVQAFPGSAVNTGNSCKDCHSVIVSNRMKVDIQPLQADLIVQLNGKTRGQLETFFVEPGDTITMSMDVLNGADKWSVQIKRLETEGQALSKDNFMSWSNPGNPGWTIQGNSTPYFTTDIAENTAPMKKSFTLMVDASTPPDVYDLEFAIAGVAGGEKFYQDEHFYLAVGMDFWAQFPVRDQGVVDTGPWLDYINVLNDPWVWNYSLANWIYLPANTETDAGTWTFIPQPTAPTTSTGDKNLGGLVYEKFYTVDAGGTGSSVRFARCKACHGWDGMGLYGGYVRRSANADRPKPILGGDLSALRGSITADQVWHTDGRSFDVEDNNMPDYSQAGGLTADQVANVVAFLNSGEQISDYATLDINANPVAYTFNGTDAIAGETLYTNNCAGCHGADGTGLGLVLGAYFSSDGKYSEGFHKMIYGIGDTSMTRAAAGELTGQQAADILTYIQAEIDVVFPTTN